MYVRQLHRTRRIGRVSTIGTYLSIYPYVSNRDEYKAAALAGWHGRYAAFLKNCRRMYVHTYIWYVPRLYGRYVEQILHTGSI